MHPYVDSYVVAMILGLFYEIRRRYLTDGNSLQPPEDFMKPVGVCSNDTREDIILRTRSSFKMPMRPQDSPSHSAHPSHRLSSANKTEKFYQYLQFNNKNWEEKEAAALLKAQYRRMEAAKKSKPSQRKLLLQVSYSLYSKSITIYFTSNFRDIQAQIPMIGMSRCRRDARYG